MELGRHIGLKTRCFKQRVGSNPTEGTNYKNTKDEMAQK